MTARRHLDAGAVGPEKLSASLRSQRYCFENFSQQPYMWQPATTGPAAVGGTDATTNVVFTGRNIFEYLVIGTASDHFGPVLGSEGGYDWQMDGDLLAEGVEINFGGIVTGHPRTFAPGLENWFARILLIVEDASGVDIVFGARQVAAYAAALTSILDIAGIEILGDSSSTTAAFSVVSNLGASGSTDYTSTAAAATPLEDATAVELEIRGISNKARFYVNGVEQVAGFLPAFAASKRVTPVLRILHTTDLAGQVKTLCFECGLEQDRTDATLLSMSSVTT